MQKLNARALGYAGASISVVCMLFFGVLGNLGFYTGAIAMMSEWHVFFSLSVGGIIGGMIEAAVWSFAILWVFGWLYNKFVTNE